ncbi:hypothetical protein BX281_8493 [Streptomyces sp. Ag82_O1-15]|nr:hypothetical protein [Streptomyces sp. Ag82_O1-15]PBD00371.1 hypothetical protein BX281_8493 [Streptomyces sp. Ag82_O1-15]
MRRTWAGACSKSAAVQMVVSVRGGNPAALRAAARAGSKAAIALPALEQCVGRRRFAWRVAGFFSARPRLHSMVSSRCAVLLATQSRRAMSDRRLSG